MQIAVLPVLYSSRLYTHTTNDSDPSISSARKKLRPSASHHRHRQYADIKIKNSPSVFVLSKLYCTMVFRNSPFLLSFLALISAQDYDNERYGGNTIVNEEFFPFDGVVESHSNLRSRLLQTGAPGGPQCRATKPANVFACGGYGGGGNDPCKNSDATCAGEHGEYDCTCTGVAETSCSYCQVRTANAILCQVTGSSTTFVSPEFQLTTCSCQYIGNGEVLQQCYIPTEAPYSAPSFPTIAPVASSITPVEVPQFQGDSVPVLLAPTTAAPLPTTVALAPTTTAPLPTTVAPAPTTAAPLATTVAPVPTTAAPLLTTVAPVGGTTTTATTDITSGGCRSIRNPTNVWVCIEDEVEASDFCELTPISCSMLPKYSCSCTGAADVVSQCGYCEVRTANSVICQTSGNELEFDAPDFSRKICRCEALANGEVQQTCWTPTSNSRSSSWQELP